MSSNPHATSTPATTAPHRISQSSKKKPGKKTKKQKVSFETPPDDSSGTTDSRKAPPKKKNPKNKNVLHDGRLSTVREALESQPESTQKKLAELVLDLFNRQKDITDQKATILRFTNDAKAFPHGLSFKAALKTHKQTVKDPQSKTNGEKFTSTLEQARKELKDIQLDQYRVTIECMKKQRQTKFLTELTAIATIYVVYYKTLRRHTDITLSNETYGAIIVALLLNDMPDDHGLLTSTLDTTRESIDREFGEDFLSNSTQTAAPALTKKQFATLASLFSPNATNPTEPDPPAETAEEEAVENNQDSSTTATTTADTTSEGTTPRIRPNPYDGLSAAARHILNQQPAPSTPARPFNYGSPPTPNEEEPDNDALDSGATEVIIESALALKPLLQELFVDLFEYMASQKALQKANHAANSLVRTKLTIDLATEVDESLTNETPATRKNVQALVASEVQKELKLRAKKKKQEQDKKKKAKKEKEGVGPTDTKRKSVPQKDTNETGKPPPSKHPKRNSQTDHETNQSYNNYMQHLQYGQYNPYNPYHTQMQAHNFLGFPPQTTYPMPPPPPPPPPQPYATLPPSTYRGRGRGGYRGRGRGGRSRGGFNSGRGNGRGQF